MNAVLQRLADERASQVEFVDQTLTRAAEDDRDLVATEIANVEAARERIGQIDLQMKPLQEFESMRASSVVIDRTIESRAPRRPSPSPVAGSLGQKFIESEQFRAYGGFGSSGRFTLDVDLRAALNTGADPGKAFLPAPERYAAPAASLTTPLLEAVLRVPVSTGSVDIVTYGQAASGIAVVAEGGDKPEATLVASVTPTPLETLAGWVEATRQLLQDAPAAQQLINSQLTRGINKKLEAQVTGVLTAATLPSVTAGSMLEGIRVGIGTIQAAGFDPSVVLANPADLAEMDVAVWLSGTGGPSIQGGYWGVRPVPVPGLPAGSPIVMDASAAVTLFERTGVEIYMTDSDVVGSGATAKSGFKANIITILGEVRAKAAVVNPNATAEITVVTVP